MKRYATLTCEALSRSIYHLAATSANTITTRLYQRGPGDVLAGRCARGIKQRRLDEESVRVRAMVTLPDDTFTLGDRFVGAAQVGTAHVNS